MSSPSFALQTCFAVSSKYQAAFLSLPSAHSSPYGDFVFASAQFFRAFGAVSGPLRTSHGSHLLLWWEYCRSSHARILVWGCFWVLQFPKVLGFMEWPEAVWMSCLLWSADGHLPLVSGNGSGPLPAVRVWYPRGWTSGSLFVLQVPMFPRPTASALLTTCLISKSCCRTWLSSLNFCYKIYLGYCQGGWHKAWTSNTLLNGILARYFLMSFLYIGGKAVNTVYVSCLFWFAWLFLLNTISWAVITNYA